MESMAKGGAHSLRSRLRVFFVLMIVTLITSCLGLFWPLWVSPSSDANRVVSGRILEHKPTPDSNGAAVVLYSYTVPGSVGEGRTFRREQAIDAQRAGRFKKGTTVPVEYSQLSPGSSRIQGFGTGSVFVQSRLPFLKQTGLVIIPAMLLILLVGVVKLRRSSE
jgi:hypothetical protein